jgi:hypothetical protein
MEPKDSKIFSKTIMQAVSAFCDANNIKDKDEFIYLCFKQGFDIKKFGLLGKTGIVDEKQVEIEVIKEIRVEVPVEIIKEVEKVVTKIEYISDKSVESELLLKIQQLESDKQLFSDKTIEMENIFQNEMSKKDNELDVLRRNLDELSKNDKTKLLQETLQNLRGELQQKNQQINELEKINRDLLNGNTNQTYLLRGSNLNRRI